MSSKSPKSADSSKNKKKKKKKKSKSSHLSVNSSNEFEFSEGFKPFGYCYFLDLTVFKVHPCKADSNTHNLKRCPYYHDQKKDQRRNLGTY
mmetsp:Transcript_7053/g.5299  ORF Transcript_7053/g.5299 Transcript_7053/m.5299 type:complete len:91 (+) Transcript_7053:718-990(+)